MANFYADFPITGGSSGGSGTVTSVGLADGSTSPIYAISGSPVTTAGTLTFTLTTQTANTVFAGPTTGAAAQPTFRALVAADLPAGGNLTDVGTDGIVVTGGTGAVLGSGTSIAQHVADSTHNGYLSSTDWTTFNNKQSTITTGNLTDVGTDGIVITGGTGAIIGSGTSIAQHVADSTHNGYLSSTDWSTFNNKQAALTIGNLTDVGTDGIVITGGTGAIIGSGTSIAQHVADSTHNGYLSSTDWTTFNNKGSGSVTSVAATVPSFLSISGSPITTTGTLAISYSGTALPVANGGTGQTTASAAFNALNPMTTTGDLIYESGANTASRLAIGSTGNVLTVSGGVPVWAAPATSGTVTSVAMTVPSFLSVSGSPVTTTGTLAVTLSGTALPVANGGTGQTTASAAFNALSPITTTGDIIYSSSGTTNARLAIGSSGNVLTVSGGVPVWSAPAGGSTATDSVTGIVTSYFPIIKSSVNSITANYTITQTDGYQIIQASTTSGNANITVTLPAASVSAGRTIKVVKTDTNDHNISFATSGGTAIGPLGNIAGGGTGQANCVKLYAQGSSIIWESDGTSWYAITSPVAMGNKEGFNFTWTGGSGGSFSNGGTVYWQRVGNQVTIFLRFCDGSSTGTANTAISAPTMPQWINAPQTPPAVFPILITTNGINSVGYAYMQNSGNGLLIYYDNTLGVNPWPSSVSFAVTSTTISYITG